MLAACSSPDKAGMALARHSPSNPRMGIFLLRQKLALARRWGQEGHSGGKPPCYRGAAARSLDTSPHSGCDQRDSAKIWYQIRIELDNDGILLVTAPAFPEVISFADDVEDALQNGRDAIGEAIARRMADGESIPQPLKDKPERGYFIEVPV